MRCKHADEVAFAHTVTEARERGWHLLKNGDLLQAAEEAAFDVFITKGKSTGSALATPTDIKPIYCFGVDTTKQGSISVPQVSLAGPPRIRLPHPAHEVLLRGSAGGRRPFVELGQHSGF
jgi:hypothetical protein